MKDITDANYAHSKRVCKDFEINILVEYHDLYVQIDTLLLDDVFENFRIYFSSWISMASSFKKDKSKMRSFN